MKCESCGFVDHSIMYPTKPPSYKCEKYGCIVSQVCMYGVLDGIEVIPGFFDTVKAAQEFADAMNTMHKEVQLHV